MSEPESRAFTTPIPGCAGQWPSPPEWFSYSSLREIEECPRRWALHRATYPAMWDRHGYPDAPSAATLTGEVMHGALEAIVDEFARAGVDDPKSSSAVDAMRRLGGFTAVVTAEVEERLGTLRDNPRVAARLPILERVMRERIPEMRERVQTILARVSFVGRGGDATGQQDTPALCGGSHAEVQLRAPALQCAGRADLITIAPDYLRISDYKTGAPDSHHAEQMRLYALLWFRDPARNPSGRLATQLVLFYPAEDVEVPAPSLEELSALEDDFVSRFADAHRLLSRTPPVARPAAEVCPRCPVRHMCQEYWTSLIAQPVLAGGGATFVDAELRVLHRNGPRSFVCRPADATGGESSEVLLRTRDVSAEFGTGMTVRLLDLLAERDEERDMPVLTVTSNSEAFPIEEPPDG